MMWMKPFFRQIEQLQSSAEVASVRTSNRTAPQ
jgi:hypothetical protein